jgi:hypothetical protein
MEATGGRSRGFGAKIPNDRHTQLLRAGRKSPCRRAANECDEFAPHHSISGSDGGGHETQDRLSFQPTSPGYLGALTVTPINRQHSRKIFIAKLIDECWATSTG